MAQRRRKPNRGNKPIVNPIANVRRAAPAAQAGNASPFVVYEAQRFKKILTEALPEEYSINKKFIEGDHWQDSEGWVGPWDESDTTAQTEIEDQFVSKNVIKEISERHAAGVLGRAPVWRVDTRDPAENQNADNTKADPVKVEIETALTDWWNKRKVHARLREACAALQWGARIPMRLFVPPGRVVGGEEGLGLPVAPDLPSALDYIFPSVPDAESATVYTDPNTEFELGIFMSKPLDPVTGLPGSEELFELTYLAPDRPGATGKALTVLKLAGKANTEIEIDLGGRLTMFMAERKLLITRQLQQQQRALNLALTMLPRNVVSSGFLERTVMNAQLQGKWEKDAEGNNVRFIADPYVAGAGVTNQLQGLEVEDDDGKLTVKDPSISYRDPTPVDPAIKATQATYLIMLEEGKQAHIILSGEALVSGKSREQARSDYDLSLTDSKDPMEMMGQWLLETALAMAEAFMGTPGKYTAKYRLIFQCHVFTGPITWEERKQNDDSIGKTLSQSRAMELNGSVDVDAAMNEMRAEQSTRIGYIAEQGTAMKALVDAGVPPEVAAEKVGFDSKTVTAIKTANEAALEQASALTEAEIDAKKSKSAPAPKPAAA